LYRHLVAGHYNTFSQYENGVERTVTYTDDDDDDDGSQMATDYNISGDDENEVGRFLLFLQVKSGGSIK
jgi:hypothetical protein